MHSDRPLTIDIGRVAPQLRDRTRNTNGLVGEGVEVARGDAWRGDAFCHFVLFGGVGGGIKWVRDGCERGR